MVNTKNFVRRLEYLLKYYNLSASAFSDKIDVQRSSVSHLLSGRNRPSLDFVMKVVKAFPEVNLYWLLNGKGSFPTNKNDEYTPFQLNEKIHQSERKETNKPKKTIDRIIIFYNDGSFDSYNN